MPTPFCHFKDELQDFLDGRLDTALSSEVQHHLETCETCRREYEALYWTKQVAAQRCAAAPAPADLRASILHSLRTEAASSQHQPPKIVPLAPQGAKPWLRPLFAIAAVALALAIVGSVWFFRQPAFPASVAQDFRDYQSQKITLQLETSDVQELEEVMGLAWAAASLFS